MIPAHAATQKIRRPAMWRSYNGLGARRCRQKNAAAGARAITARPSDQCPLVGDRREIDREHQPRHQERRTGCRRGCRPARSTR